MTQTEDGQEQELVLGNKQLLSVFFIVVVLLGVFFTMGYIIGRNTTGGTVATPQVLADSSGQGASSSSSADARPERQLEAIPAPAPSTPSEGAANTLPPANPPPGEIRTQPAKPYEDSNTAGATASPKPKQREELAAPTSPKTQKAPGTEAAVETPSGSEGKKYLQVMAVKRADAEKVQKILQGQGFPTVLHESSKGGLYRVLVGPFDDRPGLSKAKDDLKGAGFESIIAR